MRKRITFFCLQLFLGAQFVSAQEASVLHADLNRYALRSVENTISIEVKNTGDSAISSLELNWNDGEDHKATVDVHIPVGQSLVVNHPVPVKYDGIVEKEIKVGVSKVNGLGNFESLTSDAVLNFNTLTESATKAVLAEKGTGTWCPNCPAGIVAFRYMDKKYKDTFVGVAIHCSSRPGSGDNPMEFEEYLNSTGINAMPTGNIDRKIKKESFMSETAIEPFYKKRINVEAPADLSASVIADGKKLSITSKADFYGDFKAADFKMGIILIEDGVSGTGRGYAQKNKFSGGQKMGGFEKLPNPVPADQMVYDHVARALIGGYDGQSGSVPSVIKAGDSAEYTFNHTMESDKTENFYLVLVLINGDGTVANAKKLKLDDLILGVGFVDGAFESLKMYPNPVSDVLTVSLDAMQSDYEATIYDVSGRKVYSKSFKNLSLGKQNLSLPMSHLKSGTYLVSLAGNGSSYSQLVVVD